MNKIWSESEREFIRENAGKLKDKELAAKLTQMTGRLVSIQSVRKQRQKLGIAKKPGRGKCELTQGKKQLTLDNVLNPVPSQPTMSTPTPQPVLVPDDSDD